MDEIRKDCLNDVGFLGYLEESDRQTLVTSDQMVERYFVLERMTKARGMNKLTMASRDQLKRLRFIGSIHAIRL